MADVPGTIERVARALASHDAKGGAVDHIWWAWINPAKAAIEAMREPTEEMAAAGNRASLADGAHDCEVPMADVWRAMIDAASGKHQ